MYTTGVYDIADSPRWEVGGKQHLHRPWNWSEILWNGIESQLYCIIIKFYTHRTMVHRAIKFTFCTMISSLLSMPSSLVSISLTVTMSAQASPRDGLTPLILSRVPVSIAAVTCLVCVCEKEEICKKKYDFVVLTNMYSKMGMTNNYGGILMILKGEKKR